MGTRSITHIHEMKSLSSDQKIVCSFFRHSDGYPSGHGKDLADWLSDKGLKNGIGADFIKGVHFNRAGTMAVKLCNHIQDKSGCEIIHTGGKYDYIDYEYHIYFDKEFTIKVLDCGKEITKTAEEFNAEDVNLFFSED